MAKQSFATQFAKGSDYTHIGEDTTLQPPIPFGAAKWLLFSVLSFFTYGLSNIGFAIYGLNLRKRTWSKVTQFGVTNVIDAPEYMRILYKKTGDTVILASIVAFIAATVFLILVITISKDKTSQLLAIVPLLYIGVLIALPIWGYHMIKGAYIETLIQLESVKKVLLKKQEADKKAEANRKTQEIYEKLPIVPRYTADVTNPTFRSIIAGIGHHYSYTGGFAGYIIPEPNNPYDENAMAIYILDKKIGYIPKRDNIHYKVWCNNQPMPCVGCIYYKDGKYIGVLRAIRYSNIENLTRIVNDFFEWFRQNEADVEVPENLHFCVKIEPEEGGEMEFI